ncbi:uncharacterized protein LOC131876154 [Cryptomeria japonica]|uniref:uncharacterized protein LOC131876154 n=1 Tax=Cryptomeria japonica TaxID=3369 RepID=UPI0027DA0DE0|nr:uncharacterized protein LOC131876154 [Cryptomeria japonica]
MGPDQILRRCVLEEEIQAILWEAHEGPTGGHMGPDTTARKVLLARLCWPTLHNDAREWVMSCDTCQWARRPLKRDFMPLNPSNAQELFERWGLDFIGPLKASRARWIPIQLTSDRGGHFVNHIIQLLTTEFKIFYSLSSPYYPRANRQTEVTNKIIISAIYKSCGVEKEDWEECLPSVLWAYKMTYKVTTGQTPFQLMFGQEVVVPVEFMVPSLRITIDNRVGDMESLQEKLYALSKLDEKRMMAQWATKAA